MIAVTGATGYLGSALVQHLLSRGHGVVALLRPGRTIEAPRHTRLRPVEYSLGGELPIEALKGCVAGVHAAYDFSPKNWTEIQRVNVDGSLTLFEQWRAAGMGRIIFVSSRSAGAAERSFYGRAKRKVEEYCLSNGISVLRCGLVTSHGGRGLFGALERLVSRCPIIPLVGRGRQSLYLVRIEDFCAVTRYLVNRPAAHEPIELAFSEPFTLREILERIATSQKARRVFVPVPIWVIRTALRVLATAGAPIPFGEDNLDSLVAAGCPPDFAFLRAEHIAVRNPL